jgi:hypothetical protein
MLALKIFVIILAVPAMIYLIGECFDGRNPQKRTAALKTGIDRQDKPLSHHVQIGNNLVDSHKFQVYS